MQLHLDPVSTKKTSEESRDHEETSGDLKSNTSTTRQREGMAKALDVTIQTIEAIKNLVSIDIARNILTRITSILVLLRKCLENKGHSRELVRNCESICSTLALATQGASLDRMNKALTKALCALEFSIDDLQSRIEEVVQQGRACRFLTAILDEEQISTWSGELDRIFTSFSARLNIASVIGLEQTYELLKRPEFSSQIPDPPPPAPAMFFGRDELFSQVKDAILSGENVALIGPGGIGKSSIAKAVINNEDIKKVFPRRFFITYDGMDRATMTFEIFIQRIASTFGLRGSGTAIERQVRTNVEASAMLIVLDGAETFEEAVDEAEAKRISDFVARIATTSGVTVTLTSRIRSNAREVRWTRFNVPPLKKAPARQYFREVYSGQIDDKDVDMLLGKVDFHPLSIHILAYTAEESQWTGKRLLDEWHSQQVKLLQTGYGKDNLGYTVRLSLNSPSIKTHGDYALDVLWIIAFLPQGIHENHATHLFPSVPRILSILDTLHRVSLVHRSGPYLTTLAPIRLFILDALPSTGLYLLADIRNVYYSSSRSHWGASAVGDSYTNLAISDHLNMEHLVAFDITHHSGNILDIALACSGFFTGLRNHNLRPTTLAPFISLLPEKSVAEKEAKAWCLDSLGSLHGELSDMPSTATAFLAARKLLVATGDHEKAASCISNAAMAYNNLGYFSWTQRLLDDFMCSSSWEHLSRTNKAEVQFAFDWSRMFTSRESAERLFLSSVNHPFRGLESRASHWRTKMVHGYTTPEEAERNLEPIRSLCMSSFNPVDHWRFLEASADAAFLQQKFDTTMQLLDQAHDVLKGDLTLTMVVLRYKAAVASVQGKYEFARSLLQYSRDTLGVVATPSSNLFLKMLYVLGRNELYAKCYSKAHQLLTDAAVECDARCSIYAKTLCMRALGEVEICLRRETESEKYFAETVELCREAGIPPEILGMSEPMIKVDDDKFPGWKRFLQARAEG